LPASGNEKPTNKGRPASMREMKISVVGIIILCFALLAFGQPIDKNAPLTQAEYVKMLYSLQKNPSGKLAIVEALRKRGIAFVVTDGIRSLTRSKGANDDELKRALEEADRRRQNPASTKLPSQAESDAILEKARAATLQALDEMPDFVVKQRITRSAAYAGTGNWRPYSNLIIAVSYSTEKGELYQVLVLDGARVNADKGSNYGGLTGATTAGEFVENLQKLFKAESKTKFEATETDVVGNRPALVFTYQINIENNKGGGVTYRNVLTQTSPAGEIGKVWIDRETFRILRLEFQLTDIERGFPITAFQSSTDYDWVKIGDENYLLPAKSDAKFTVRESNIMTQQRNVIYFRNYQKYGSEVRILDDDITPTPEPTPVKPD
jgi:hypothetical protein